MRTLLRTNGVVVAVVVAVSSVTADIGDLSGGADLTQDADMAYESIEAAMDAGDMQQAIQIVNTDLSVVSFALGMDALEKGDNENALLALERTLSLDPTNDRARLELARAMYAGGDFKRAQNQFQAVIDHNPPAAVKRNIEVYIDRIREWDRKWHFGTQFAGGAFYDTNVNVGPDSDSIRINPISVFGASFDTLDIEEAFLPQESWGLFAFLGGFALYDAGKRGDWSAVGGGQYYQTWLQDAEDFEILYYSASLGPRFVAQKHFFESPLRYEHIDQGGKELVSITGLLPAYTYLAGTKRHWTTRARLQQRDYAELDDTDSTYVQVGETVRHFYGPLKNSVSLGLDIFYEDAEADIFTNLGLETFLGGSLKLAWNTTWYLRGKYRGSWYDEQEVLALEKRRDDEFQFFTGLNKPFGKNLSADVSYQYTQRLSTFDIYDYTRNILTLGLNGDF